MPSPRCRLYLITPPRLASLDGFAEALAQALTAGDVACVQLRLKAQDGGPAEQAHVRAAARTLMPIAHEADAAFIINDRPDLAADLGADGVHVGQTDADYAAARACVGADAIVGVTCHASRHLAMVAAEAGADYVAFGAFYPSGTKAAASRAEPEILHWWSELFTTPCVAIGGVTAENCAALAEAGADFLAVSGAVWGDPDGPAAAVRRMQRAIDRTVENPRAAPQFR